MLCRFSLLRWPYLRLGPTSRHKLMSTVFLRGDGTCRNGSLASASFRGPTLLPR